MGSEQCFIFIVDALGRGASLFSAVLAGHGSITAASTAAIASAIDAAIPCGHTIPAAATTSSERQRNKHGRRPAANCGHSKRKISEQHGLPDLIVKKSLLPSPQQALEHVLK
ncbi:hypothetical protein EGT07_21155 [Herbaspirillum sp. HC18]|nr:hypothetical protein EGT07_21155 [Herbaspirillum sp. HC18]